HPDGLGQVGYLARLRFPSLRLNDKIFRQLIGFDFEIVCADEDIDGVLGRMDADDDAGDIGAGRSAAIPAVYCRSAIIPAAGICTAAKGYYRVPIQGQISDDAHAFLEIEKRRRLAVEVEPGVRVQVQFQVVSAAGVQDDPILRLDRFEDAADHR